MANLAQTIPVRGFTKVMPSWFNALRDVLISIAGGGSIGETSFAIANSQTNSDVTGLSFDGTKYRRALLEVDVKRGTGGAAKHAYFFLSFVYRNGAWEKTSLSSDGDSDHGMDFNITVGGQVQYTSDATATGTMKYRARTFDA